LRRRGLPSMPVIVLPRLGPPASSAGPPWVACQRRRPGAREAAHWEPGSEKRQGRHGKSWTLRGVKTPARKTHMQARDRPSHLGLFSPWPVRVAPFLRILGNSADAISNERAQQLPPWRDHTEQREGTGPQLRDGGVEKHRVGGSRYMGVGWLARRPWTGSRSAFLANRWTQRSSFPIAGVDTGGTPRKTTGGE
jgi:hypothetical protein